MNLVKKIVKIIIPKRVIYLLKTIIAYWSEIKRYAFFRIHILDLDNQTKTKGYMTILYHIVEKGLTMPETRFGFGSQVILDLAGLCNFYLQKNFDSRDQVFIHSIEVLNEYLRFHELHNFPLCLFSRRS